MFKGSILDLQLWSWCTHGHLIIGLFVFATRAALRLGDTGRVKKNVRTWPNYIIPQHSRISKNVLAQNKTPWRAKLSVNDLVNGLVAHVCSCCDPRNRALSMSKNQCVVHIAAASTLDPACKMWNMPSSWRVAQTYGLSLAMQTIWKTMETKFGVHFGIVHRRWSTAGEPGRICWDTWSDLTIWFAVRSKNQIQPIGPETNNRKGNLPNQTKKQTKANPNEQCKATCLGHRSGWWMRQSPS